MLEWRNSKPLGNRLKVVVSTGAMLAGEVQTWLMSCLRCRVTNGCVPPCQAPRFFQHSSAQLPARLYHPLRGHQFAFLSFGLNEAVATNIVAR
jgi:hypothetical protein